MKMYKKEMIIKGKPVKFDAMQVADKGIIVRGKIIRIGKLQDEWSEDIGDPDVVIEALKEARLKPDIFTFWQRVPESEPRYNYYKEWDNVAAMRIKSFEHWWQKQIDAKTRNVNRNAQKKGVITKEVDFDDELVRGIRNIFNESRIRQGKLFWHYGKDFETVKKEMSLDLVRSYFIGAYYNEDLIGFIKLLDVGNGARVVQILSRIEHRDKSPTNSLIGKAVEVCCKKGIPYLFYEKFEYGKTGSRTLTDFKRHNGFEKIQIPRYYVPLTTAGKIILKLNLHRGVKEMLPKRLVLGVMDYRRKWYTRKYSCVKNG
jgi:hypothetical protein